MARQGGGLENPVTGERLVFRRTSGDPLQIAVMAKEYRDEAQFPLVPAVVQRALVAPLAAIGARLGYRAFDPRYGAHLRIGP